MGSSSIAFVALVQNAALLLASALLFDIFASRWRSGQPFPLQKIGIGCILGIIGMGVMFTPWIFIPGVVFDTRSVLIATTGLFFGVIPTVTAMAMTAALRLYQGGPGAWTGVYVILASGIIGMAWGYRRKGHLENLSWLELYLFGLTIHLVMLAIFFTLPREIAAQVLRTITVPVLLIYPLGTALLGSLMVGRLTREKVDDALRKANRLLEDVLDAVTDIISIQNPDRTIVRCNRAGYESMRVAPEAVAGKPCHFLIGRTEPCGTCATSHAMQSKELETVERFVPELRRHFLCRSNPILDDNGEVRLIIEQFHDITERKRTEEVLRASRRRAASQRAAIAELALDPHIVSGDFDLAIQRIAEVAATTIAVARASIWKLSEDGAELNCLTLYEADAQAHTRGATLKTSVFPHYFEAILRENWICAEDAQGDPRTSELAESYLAPLGITSMLDAGILIEGRLVGVICLEHMGRLRKWHSDEESFATTLAAIVAQLLLNSECKRTGEEREKLQAQLLQSQKMESVGRLAGGVAHDYNNMLGVIMGYTELAKYKLHPHDPLHADLEEILKAARRSMEVTRQLLAFAREQTIRPRILNLNESVESMLKMLRPLLGEDVALSWRPQSDLWLVKMDPSQIDQILANLCVNARDAISGTGRITIETRNATFDEAHCARHEEFVPGHFVVLVVKDDGCGMDRQTLEKIFDPFFTTKELGQGTGLGLATVYGIIKQNDGFINVHSEPGQGATFEIYLPGYVDRPEDQDGETMKTESGGAIPLGRNEMVLLVEDELTILDMCRMILGKLGYQVLAAGTADDAIRLASEYSGKIDLLITDVIMPQMNGRELAEQVRAFCPHIRTLFMSGYTADIIAHHGILEDGVNFIEKPFLMEDLAQKIRGVLDHENRLAVGF